VGRRLVDEGNLVGAGEKTLLTTVVSMDPIYAYFDVDERKLLEFLKLHNKGFDGTKGYKCHVGLDTEEGYPHEGRVDYINNRVDPGTGTGWTPERAPSRYAR
jgi:hypothetical protein